MLPGEDLFLIPSSVLECPFQYVQLDYIDCMCVCVLKNF